MGYNITAMSLFRPYTFTWRQMAIFKIGLIALGIAIGVYWYDVFAFYLEAIIALALVCSLYIAWVSFRS